MSTGLYILLGLLLAAILGVLFLGVVGLAKSGGNDPRRSNILMRWRVGLQACAVLLLLVILLLQG